MANEEFISTVKNIIDKIPGGIDGFVYDENHSLILTSHKNGLEVYYTDIKWPGEKGKIRLDLWKEFILELGYKNQNLQNINYIGNFTSSEMHPYFSKSNDEILKEKSPDFGLRKYKIQDIGNGQVKISIIEKFILQDLIDENNEEEFYEKDEAQSSDSIYIPENVINILENVVEDTNTEYCGASGIYIIYKDIKSVEKKIIPLFKQSFDILETKYVIKEIDKNTLFINFDKLYIYIGEDAYYEIEEGDLSDTTNKVLNKYFYSIFDILKTFKGLSYKGFYIYCVVYENGGDSSADILSYECGDDLPYLTDILNLLSINDIKELLEGYGFQRDEEIRFLEKYGSKDCKKMLNKAMM